MTPRRGRGHAAPGLVLASCLLAAVVAPLHAEPLRSLGKLERESVDEALALLGITVDPSPEGKVIGHVYVVNQDVFSRHDWYLQLLNALHRTTLPTILERELLLGAGQVWNEALADESVRNLQGTPPMFFENGALFAGPQLSSVVAIVPIASSVPGAVDLLAVTRDLWSLRFNTNFAFQKDRLSLLETSLSENNLFGWRKFFAANFQMDLGRFGVGPQYYDPNIAGTRLTMMAMGIAWYARDSQRYEGNRELFTLRYPLYSLASRWGVTFNFDHHDELNRKFCEAELCPVDVGGTTVPFVYRHRALITEARVTRSFGQAIVQRVSLGYRFNRQRSLVADDTTAPPLTDAFLAAWAPLPETRSEPYVRYELSSGQYGVTRDLDTFDLRENRRLGPQLSLEAAAGLTALGANFLAYPLSAAAGWSFTPGGSGFALGQVQASARAHAGGLIDERLSAVLYFASPLIARAGRVVLEATTDVARQDTRRTRFFLGGDTGMRGYEIGEFQGTAQAAAHAELRTVPLAVYSQRFGAVLFYDVGHAADSYQALVPHNDLGLGLRWLIPQLNTSTVRIDWAIPLQDGPYSRAGLPGRITAGFMQSFWLLDSPNGFLANF